MEVVLGLSLRRLVVSPNRVFAVLFDDDAAAAFPETIELLAAIGDELKRVIFGLEFPA